jgi:hypothetical protein
MSLPFGTDPSALPQQGGSATRGEFAPVLDSEKPPITAGSFVKHGPVIFRDIAEKPASPRGGTPWALRREITFLRPQVPASPCWITTTTSEEAELREKG